ncbi:MAG TPA: AraC family transcriptional regulator [Polyangiaceae bacterium]|nr:AraC family transcriptional regulator [Polyangiaceae bacterium]
MFVRLHRARDRLCDTLDEPLALSKVADEAGLSIGEFIRRFSALHGETPHQRRIRARIERAKALLALGNHSVTEVCFEVGFQSLGSFSERFARMVGERPSAYRRRLKHAISAPRQSFRRVVQPGCFELMAAAFAAGAAVGGQGREGGG